MITCPHCESDLTVLLGKYKVVTGKETRTYKLYDCFNCDKEFEVDD